MYVWDGSMRSNVHPNQFYINVLLCFTMLHHVLLSSKHLSYSLLSIFFALSSDVLVDVSRVWFDSCALPSVCDRVPWAMHGMHHVSVRFKSVQVRSCFN